MIIIIIIDKMQILGYSYCISSDFTKNLWLILIIMELLKEMIN